jgi:hypothetical protein
MLVRRASINAGTLRDLGNAQALLSVPRQDFSSGFQNCFACAFRVAYAADSFHSRRPL